MKRRGGYKQNFLDDTEISLWIDHYNDIFSDFDPRPYSHRALSDDFLVETKRASADKSFDELKLKFLVPSHKRNRYEEEIIKDRLDKHFNHHFDILSNEKRKIIVEGVVFMILGFILMFTAAFVLFRYNNHNLLTNFLIVSLEPGGWFFFWEGLDLILFETKKIKMDFNFYKKMANCKIHFLPYHQKK